jgi:hypothetical protein
MSIFESETVPADEIEAAGDALRILWQSNENQAALKATGHGANWFWQARLALEAAAAVRGRQLVRHGTEQ